MSARHWLVLVPIAALALGAPPAGAAPAPRLAKPEKVVRADGQIGPSVRLFKSLLGPDRGGVPRHYRSGRRELVWDAVPDEFAAPHALPGDFFNARRAPRARGAVLATPGDHVAVSADADNPDAAPVRFGDVNPAYVDQFQTFSAERLFSPIGSNLVNLSFRVPGTARRAGVRGFGAVYTDVDRRENTAFEYFDRSGRSLGKFAVPPAPQGLSFLGVVFDKPIVARVKIEYGSGALGPVDDGNYDAAVMDDFVYGEPQALPRRR
jgi:hypothetical protein